MSSIIKHLVAAAVIIVALLAPDKSAAQEQFTRGLEHISFVPKGQWITGISVNYDQNNQSDYQFLIVEGLNGNSYSFKVSPMLMYAIRDNLDIGGRFAYQRSMNKMESGTV